MVIKFDKGTAAGVQSNVIHPFDIAQPFERNFMLAWNHPYTYSTSTFANSPSEIDMEREGSVKESGERPPISYSELIIEAISSSEKKMLRLGDIYSYIKNKYPYYRSCSNVSRTDQGVEKLYSS
jgi:hypothetical protein